MVFLEVFDKAVVASFVELVMSEAGELNDALPKLHLCSAESTVLQGRLGNAKMHSLSQPITNGRFPLKPPSILLFAPDRGLALHEIKIAVEL